VRELRKKVGEKISDKRDEDFSPPLDFSAKIRRVEDGFDHPNTIKDEYGEDYLEAVNDILDKSYGEDEDSGDGISKFKKEVKKFTGQTDKYYLPDGDQGEILEDLTYRFKFSYYFDIKTTLGLYTMK
jgi:hypothetical protein